LLLIVLVEGGERGVHGEMAERGAVASRARLEVGDGNDEWAQDVSERREGGELGHTVGPNRLSEEIKAAGLLCWAKEKAGWADCEKEKKRDGERVCGLGLNFFL
jgi:hypothetical protein